MISQNIQDVVTTSRYNLVIFSRKFNNKKCKINLKFQMKENANMCEMFALYSCIV